MSRRGLCVLTVVAVGAVVALAVAAGRLHTVAEVNGLLSRRAGPPPLRVVPDAA